MLVVVVDYQKNAKKKNKKKQIVRGTHDPRTHQTKPAPMELDVVPAMYVIYPDAPALAQSKATKKNRKKRTSTSSSSNPQ